ncbi:hypothetical protein AVEN_100889-1 [Araneus ventricosus]|uniref:Tc1-like transposase DDE domain-containing protein n=1 Tax=Araneus ventricosus TaxID=182803 RepID=A0A4Y2AWX2_ARAVE|nr:hypothetical protein AVEN_100889-1 [Araneus ventricosus]
MAAASFIRVISRHGKVTKRYWMKPLAPPPDGKRWTPERVWFQHDGAPAHKTSAVKHYLVEEFEEQIIRYGGFQEWPPRSPELIPMAFFMWGYLKQYVYAISPPILQDLQRRITDACANVTPSMLHRVEREVQPRVGVSFLAVEEKFEHRK